MLMAAPSYSQTTFPNNDRPSDCPGEAADLVIHFALSAMGLGVSARIGVDDDVSARKGFEDAFFSRDHDLVRQNERGVGIDVGVHLDVDGRSRRARPQLMHRAQARIGHRQFGDARAVAVR